MPTLDPTEFPTEFPTYYPSEFPTEQPSEEPTEDPTVEPTRDCDLLDIDQFLLHCSAEWEDAGHVKDVLFNATATNSQAMVQLADSVTNAAAAISTNADNIATLTSNASVYAAAIVALETKVVELEDKLHRMSVHSAHSVPGALDLDDRVGMSKWTLTGKDLGIVVLAAINMVMIAIIVIACKRPGGGTQYQPVAVCSDVEPINA